MKLAQEQKRIKIAEARGWKYISNSGNHGIPYGLPPDAPDTLPRDLQNLPDYFNDRDAIIVAVEQIPYERQPYYMQHLTRDVMMKDAGVSDFERHNATAAQRAEAFGLTLGLWKEGE